MRKFVEGLDTRRYPKLINKHSLLWIPWSPFPLAKEPLKENRKNQEDRADQLTHEQETCDGQHKAGPALIPMLEVPTKQSKVHCQVQFHTPQQQGKAKWSLWDWITFFSLHNCTSLGLWDKQHYFCLWCNFTAIQRYAGAKTFTVASEAHNLTLNKKKITGMPSDKIQSFLLKVLLKRVLAAL